jgi:hypothetical protein
VRRPAYLALLSAAVVAAELVSPPPALAAEPASPPPPVVCVGRVQEFLLPLGPLTPPAFYPEGKISDLAVREALRLALSGLAGGKDGERWLASNFAPAERVGIQVDCQWPPVSMVLVDVLIDELVHAGLSSDRIYVYGGDERELFRAGLVVRRNGSGVKVLGTASEGFRHGLSRVVLDYCDALINVARLRADSRLGLWGCIANHLSCVDYPERMAALRKPEMLCAIASRPTVRLKMRLHLLDALQPPYEPATGSVLPPRWPYGGIIASRDGVAADVVGWRLLEAYRAQRAGQPSPLVPQPLYLAAARKYGLSDAFSGPVQLLVRGYQADALVK